MSVGNDTQNTAYLIGYWEPFWTTQSQSNGSNGLPGQSNSSTSCDGSLLLARGSQFDQTESFGDPFDTDAGTIAITFLQNDPVEHASGILICRGVSGAAEQGNYFAVEVTEDGRVSVIHKTSSATLTLHTSQGFVGTGDQIDVSYGWSAETGGTLSVKNLSTGAKEREHVLLRGLGFGLTDPKAPCFSIRAFAQPTLPSNVDCAVLSVAIYDRDLISNEKSEASIPSGGEHAICGEDAIDHGLSDARRDIHFPASRSGRRGSESATGETAQSRIRNDVLDDVHDDHGGAGVTRGDHVDIGDRQAAVLSQKTKCAAAVFSNTAHLAPTILVTTPDGDRALETLRVGDKVITRDNGFQEISWTGTCGVTASALNKQPHLKPIAIVQGALGEGLPRNDMWLMPNQRLLVSRDKTALYFEQPEAFVSAKHLTALEGVSVVEPRWMTYHHILFPQHETIKLNGSWVEIFQPGDYSQSNVGNAQRLEIEELFPQFEPSASRASFQAARRPEPKKEIHTHDRI